MSGCAIACAISELSVLRIGLGNPAGPSAPYHGMDEKPGTPDSEIVGRSGACGERFGLEIAMARSFPART
jgi:hypothetical protein